MISEFRPIIMRANRLLGAALVEHNFVKIEDLERANERLLELLGSEQIRQATVLGILAYELKVLREEDVLLHLADTESLGLVDLRTYEINDDCRKATDLGAAWSTWSVPYDKEEGITFMATAYYLSPAVRSYWEKQLGTTAIIWYCTTLDIIGEYLEKPDKERRPSSASAAASA